MRRREFIAGTAATAATGFARPTWAQTNARPTGARRLAIFHPTRPPEEQTRDHQSTSYKAYFDELNRLGYIEGQNLIVERYSAFGQSSRIADAAREIVASRPDVVWSWSAPLTEEIMALTTSIPIVGMTADPVAYGLSSSLARPDKNVTGVVLDAGLEIWAKRVQLLLEVARKVTKVGFLNVNPTFMPGPAGANIREAAQRAGVAAAFVVVAGKIDRAAYERVWPTLIVGGEKVDQTTFEESFDAINKEGVDGLIVGEGSELSAYRQLIADLAARFRVPAIYPFREYVEVGGLMAYAVNTADIMRRVANMTSQVLGGAKVSDLPFYRQTKHELVLNQKAATSLELEFPTSLLATADAVVE